MDKIRRFSDLQGQFRFPNVDTDYDELYQAFLRSKIGETYLGVPWQQLVEAFDLKDNKKGPLATFSPKGKIALMFLKHYAACSDSKLIEQLNGNIYYQIFCDIIIPVGQPLTNFKIVSEIRCELAEKLNIALAQSCLATYWKPYMTNLESMCCDATCYETDMRYPTDIKLLWETVLWNHKKLKLICKQTGHKVIRTKFSKWRKRYANYSKSKRPSRKEKQALKRALLLLLVKVDKALSEVEILVQNQLTATYWTRRSSSKKVLEQQWALFHENVKPKDRIVSLHKSYVRPIVRGKETKKVEFGAKLHKFQIDGISFIEHISFDAFNEGTRLKSTIWSAQKLFNKKLKVVGADKIYATNKNRNYVSKSSIKTDFKRKGKPSKHKEHFSLLSKMITKERASRLEGSFGTDKEHFLLNRIKAKTQKTEVLWIFFGIHTSNALKIGRMINAAKKSAA